MSRKPNVTNLRVGHIYRHENQYLEFINKVNSRYLYLSISDTEDYVHNDCCWQEHEGVTAYQEGNICLICDIFCEDV